MRFLHTADLHLGQIMYQYYDRVDEHDHFFKQLKEWCGEYHPDALLVSGDVFDIQQPSAAVKAYFNNRFVELHRQFPEMAIVVTAGNHDSASRIEADSEVWGMSGVTLVGYGPASDVLEHDDGWQDRFIVELPTGFIVALPFMSSHRPDVVQSLLDRVEQRNAAGLPVVLMGHQAVGGSDYTGHSDIGNLRMLTGDEMGKGYDYLALGHIHRPQTLNHDLADEYTEHSSYLSGIMRYSGSALHVSCDEQYPHSVSLVDIDRHNGNVELRRLTINELRHFYLLPDIDKDAAIKAMVETATCPYYESVGDYMKYGYAPYDKYSTAASNTLEYSYDDFALYAAAKAAGYKDVEEAFAKRALYYRNTFDTKVGFASPRRIDGSFKADLDPYQTYGEGFIEGNSWNFSFSAPQDVMGLISLFGGDKNFLKKLDALFVMDLPEKYYKDNEDITAECLVGGYVHGNEPSHHIPYLYAWTSAPWKTQMWMRTILNKMYRNHIRGLGGNDDCGQMSAWYVFSSLGFYPVCPGTDQYVIGAPYMPYFDVRLENGNHIIVKAPGVSDKNRYVQSMKVNGKPYTKMYITHKMLTDGCTIEFVMGSKPNKKRGLSAADKPYSMTK